jgi:hypothetical protein
MVSVAVAHLPTAVSLLLLAVLFMQISGVRLALTWLCRLCLLRVLLCTSLCYKLSPFQAHWGRWHCTSFLRPACLFTVHVGSGSSPFSCGVFLPLPLLQVFPLLITGRCCCSCQPPQLTWEVGLPPSPVEFSSLCHSHKFSCSWLLGSHPRSHRSLSACPACLFTVLGRIPFPTSLELSAPHPLSHISLLFLLLITQFLFFCWVEVSFSRGLC